MYIFGILKYDAGVDVGRKVKFREESAVQENNLASMAGEEKLMRN